MTDDNVLWNDLPEPPPLDEQDRIRRESGELGRLAREIHAQVNGPSRRVGTAVDHSIEDPFTGQITVTVRLD